MGSKYTSQATSGYDASPPSDDGTVSEANKVKWSTIKSKLTTVLKTFIEAVNTQLVTTLDTSPRSLSASGSTASTDHWKTIQVTTASVTVTLAAAASMTAGYIVNVANQSSGTITVACASTDTIDTVTNTTHTLSAYECREYIVNSGASGYITKSAKASIPTLGAEQASTSGTSIDFTNIPPWVKRITIMYVGVSTNGSSAYRVQIGGSGGVETSGYVSASTVLQDAAAVTVSSSTSGFDLNNAMGSGDTLTGSVTLTLEDLSDNTWIMSSSLFRTGTVQVHMASGSKSLSATLDRVRVTTANGTDTFDAGAVNILYS